MRQFLINDLKKYFVAKQYPTKQEEDIMQKLAIVSKNFPITVLSYDDLRYKGFDVSNVDKSTMESLASKLSDDYCGQLFWESMEYIAEHVYDIPKMLCATCNEVLVYEDDVWKCFNEECSQEKDAFTLK